MIAGADATLDAILAAVIADPADPLHRLAFADWCEENGDEERAALVRGPARECGDASDHSIRDFLSASPSTVLTLVSRRGFVDEARCSAAHWREHGPALVRSHPLTRVVLTDLIPRRRDTGPNGWSIWLLAWDPGGGPLSPWSSFPFVPSAGSRSRELAFSDLSDSCLRWARSCEPVRVPDAIVGAQ